MIKILFILIAGGWFFYALIRKPDWLAIMFFTVAIADINFDPPGSPLNFRTLLCFIVIIRLMFEKTRVPRPTFFNVPTNLFIVGFAIYVIGVTHYHDLLFMSVVTELIISMLCVFLAYYYYMRENGYHIFKISLIIAGFICLADLAWTYKQGYGLYIQRVYYLFTPAWEVINHNFFGYIGASAFVFLLSDYLARKGERYKWNLWLLPFMFMTVMLSTSRSALLIMVIISVVLMAKAMLSKENSTKAYKLIVVALSCLVLCLCLFQMLSTVFGLNSEFLETIASRLIEEPMAIINRALGKDFDAASLDSMDWRAEASEIAYQAFTEKITRSEQIFGIGNDGFMERGLGFLGTYAAHNGILLMLIEFGIIGFTWFHLILINLVVKTSKKGYFSPLSVVLVFIFLYVISHNRETTSLFAYLLLGTMSGEAVSPIYEPEEDELVELDEISIAPNQLN